MHRRTIHFTVGMWTGYLQRYLSLNVHWWQPEGLKNADLWALTMGLQEELLVLPPGYKADLLQAWRMDKKYMGWNIT